MGLVHVMSGVLTTLHLLGAEAGQGEDGGVPVRHMHQAAAGPGGQGQGPVNQGGCAGPPLPQCVLGTPAGIEILNILLTLTLCS